MTGVGERSHLLDAKVSLATHVTDIVNVIKWERLSDIVLVGHSYGGMVITGVAEQVQKVVGSIVFLDAFFPENGQALVDLAPQTTRDAVRMAKERSEISLKPLPAAFFEVNEKDRAWVDTMCTMHPVATFTDKVMETGARERIAKKAYVRATGHPGAAFDAAYTKYRSIPGWRTYGVPCGHYVMVDMPER